MSRNKAPQTNRTFSKATRVFKSARNIREADGDPDETQQHEDDEREKPSSSSSSLFSGQEEEGLRIAFQIHADEDENAVHRGNLKKLLKTLFIVPTTAELEMLASKMDPPEETGWIDFESFFTAIAGFMKPQHDRAKVDKAFDEIAGEGMHQIDAPSLQRAMVRLGYSTIRAADCEAMIREVDRTGEGYITKEDFYHLQTRSFENL